MAYGVVIYDSKGRNLIDFMVPMFFLDYISYPPSGSRTYPTETGRTLVAYLNGYVASADLQGMGGIAGVPVVAASVSISGNIVTWNNVSAAQSVIVGLA